MRRYALVLIIVSMACITNPMVIDNAVAEELHIFAGAGLRGGIMSIDHTPRSIHLTAVSLDDLL